jgi:hypothetical protein
MEIFKLFGSIFVDTTKADESISKTDGKVDKLAKNFMKGVETAAKWGIGIATAIGTAAVTVTETTREYRNEMAKLDTAYETAGFTAESAKKVYEALNSVLGDTGQAVEASNHLAQLCDTEEELTTWTDICTGVYATFGDSLPIEGLTEAANETAKVGTLTGSLADALNWAGINEEEFQARLDECSTEQERQELITSTLNDLYAEAAEAYRINNKEILEANSAQERLTAATAAVGEKLEPLITNFKNFTALLLEEAIPFVASLVEGNNSLGIVLGIVATAVGVLMTAVTMYNVVQGIKAAMDAAEVTTLGALIKVKLASAVATTAAVAPYLLVATAIAAVIAIGVALYKNWDTIKEKCGKLASNVSKKFTEIKNAVTEKVQAMKNAVTEKFQSMKSSAVEKMESLKTSAVSKFDAIKDGIKEKINAAKDTVKKAIDKIKEFFKFDVSLPKIKLPHFSIKPKGWELGDLMEGSIPTLGIEWYAKAMDNPMVMTKPTVFGYNAATGQLMGGGEAGSEVVSGTNTLMNMISTAVATQNSEMVYYLQRLIQILAEYFPQVLESMDRDVVLDSGVLVGELAPGMDKALGKLAVRKGRGI